MTRRSETTFLNGVPELLILKLLSTESMYGYQIAQEIRRRTGGDLHLGEGVLYPLLHGLEERGLLRAWEREHSGRTRVYYDLTRKGRRRLDDVSGRWRAIHGAVLALLEWKRA